jgi:hypothetical protein
VSAVASASAVCFDIIAAPLEYFDHTRVEEVGKCVRQWRGHYFVYVHREDGTEARKHKMVTLGPKAKLKKFEAEQKLREIIAREVGTGGARQDDTVSLEWFLEKQISAAEDLASFDP